jgi:hypothetical protein
MFSALRQGSIVYVLDKGENSFLKKGSIVSYTAPQPVFGQPMNYTVDIKANVDGQLMEFQKLPSGLDIASDAANGLVVSTTQEAMLAEVSEWVNNSEIELTKQPYHENVVKVGEGYKKMLDPAYAKRTEQEEKLAILESKVNGIETNISDIKDMVSQVLNTKERK